MFHLFWRSKMSVLKKYFSVSVANVATSGLGVGLMPDGWVVVQSSLSALGQKMGLGTLGARDSRYILRGHPTELGHGIFV